MGKLVVTLDWPYTNIPWIWVSSLLASDVIKEPNVEFIRSQTTDMNCSGNMLMRSAIERGATEILAVSADQSFPSDILSRLRAHNKDVVSALAATRQVGHHWLAFNLNEKGIGMKANPKFPCEKVDIPSSGCVLYKAHIFNKVPPPWFKTTLTKDGTGIVQTSDFYFFKKLKEYGIECYVDSTLESYHQTEIYLSTTTLGRKLPYIDIIENNDRIPCTSKDQDAIDDSPDWCNRYDSGSETTLTYMEGL